MIRQITAENGVTYLASSLITVRHGFSTRVGGVSTQEHLASLNLGTSADDTAENVAENLRRFTFAIGIDAADVVSMPQIHSATVITATADMRGEGYFRAPRLSCDGYVTAERGVALAVRTADCLPILLYEPNAKIIGALHAGWRGSVGGIATAGIDAMKSLGAKVENIRAAFGAAIGKCCYVVGEDVFSAARALVGSNAEAFFSSEGDGKYRADLPSLNRYLLEASGVPHGNIDDGGRCTCCESKLFFSHRASHGKRGTMLSVIEM